MMASSPIYKGRRMTEVMMLKTKALRAQVREAGKLCILAYLSTFLELERANMARKSEIP